MRRALQSCAVGILVMVVALASGTADDSVPESSVAPNPGAGDDGCSLPSDATPVAYRVLRTIDYPDSQLPRPVVSPEPAPDYRLVSGQLIDDASQFASIFGTDAPDVDWHDVRIVVFEEYTSYRLGVADGDLRFTGVYRSGGVLIVSSTYSYYGPCQGIAQDPSWFSFAHRYLLLVVPRSPAQITFASCAVGGCPPDIP